MKTKLPFHLIILLSLLVAASPARAGAPASANFTSDSLSTPITTITRISVDSNGVQGNKWSDSPSTSADGRYVAFRSIASNWVSGDTDLSFDIFLRDTHTGITTLVSVDSSGVKMTSDSSNPSISSDGRYVAFNNGYYWDVFLRDTQIGTTALVSVDSSETEGYGNSGYPSISADGRYVAFWSDANNLVSGDKYYNDIFLRDTLLGTTACVSVDSSGT